MGGGSILHVADYSSAFASAFIASVLRLEGVVRDRLGLRTVLALPEGARAKPWLHPIEEAGVVVRFIEKASSHHSRIRSLSRLGNEWESRILHTHFGTFDVDAAVAAKGLESAAIWHMHSPFTGGATLRHDLGERAKFAIAARLLAGRIVAVSPSVADSAVSIGAPASKFVVVLNGIDADRIRPVDATTRGMLRRRNGIAEEQTAFLLFGWSPVRKGVDILLRALETLPPSVGTKVVCLIVSGEDNKPTLRQMAEGIGAVRIVQSVQDVVELYGAVDCLVSASRAEGLPYAIGEAMASELIVISSNLPQVAKVYGPAGSGLLTFSTAEPEDLARAMTEVVECPSKERRLRGRTNREYIVGHLSLDRWAEEIVAVYRSCLEARRGAET